MKTLKQLIEDLKWFDLIRQLKELFRKLQDSPIQPKLEAGNNITFSGEGTEQSPLKINSVGGSGGNQDLQSVLDTGSTASITSYVSVQSSAPIHFVSGSSTLQVNQGSTTYGLDFTGKDFLLNSVGNGQIYSNSSVGINIEGQSTKGIKLYGNSGEISLDAQGNSLKLSQGEILLQSPSGVKLVNTPQQDNSVTKGLARQSSGRIVEYDLPSQDSGFIPLSGTTNENPVTGDIEIDDGNKIFNINEGEDQNSEFSFEDGKAILRTTKISEGYGTEISTTSENVLINSNYSESIGILGSILFNKQNNPNSFAQLGDVNLRVPTPPTTGTYTLQSINGVTSWVTT